MAYDGKQALELAAADSPDVILLDIGLPGMDGYEVARAVRGDRRLSGVKVIALSGFGREEDRRCSREVGFDAHLIKPADLASLQAAIGAPKSAATHS